jgi:hypothetical protein
MKILGVALANIAVANSIRTTPPAVAVPLGKRGTKEGVFHLAIPNPFMTLSCFLL